MTCVKKVMVDESNCLKPCSGLYVTSFSQSEEIKKLDAAIPLIGAYKEYKNNTQFPTEYNGNAILEL